MTMKILATLTASAALMTGAALAGDMSDYDTDGDGLLSLEEIQAAKPDVTEDEFNEYDEDGDGFLDEDEYNLWKEAKEAMKDVADEAGEAMEDAGDEIEEAGDDLEDATDNDY
jgi:hypothetical protein